MEDCTRAFYQCVICYQYVLSTCTCFGTSLDRQGNLVTKWIEKEWNVDKSAAKCLQLCLQSTAPSQQNQLVVCMSFIKKEESWKSTSSTSTGLQSWSHPEDIVQVLCLDHELTSHCSCKVFWATSITTALMFSCSSLIGSPRSSCSIVHNSLSHVGAGATPGTPAALVPIPSSQTAPCSSMSSSPSSPCACTATSSSSHAVSTQQALLFPSCHFVAAIEVLLSHSSSDDRRRSNHSIAEGLKSLSSWWEGPEPSSQSSWTRAATSLAWIIANKNVLSQLLSNCKIWTRKAQHFKCCNRRNLCTRKNFVLQRLPTFIRWKFSYSDGGVRHTCIRVWFLYATKFGPSHEKKGLMALFCEFEVFRSFESYVIGEHRIENRLEKFHPRTKLWLFSSSPVTQ